MKLLKKSLQALKRKISFEMRGGSNPTNTENKNQVSVNFFWISFFK